MTGGMNHAVGSTAVLCLDPTVLPVRYAASDPRADGRERIIEIHREGVVLSRCMAGMDMTLRVPLSRYQGVAVRYFPGENPDDDRIAVMLEHDDPGLSIPLYVDSEGDDLLFQWRMWSKSLARPLLIAAPDGSVGLCNARLGALDIAQSIERRRRRSALARRHSSARLRRRKGHSRPMPVHQEPEISARAMED
jgi:hypothetical protein